MSTGPGTTAPGTALVIGARGTLGSLVADAFEHAGWEVRRGSRGDDGGVLVDLDRPETVAAALDGADVAVNTVPHTGLSAERAVLERGGALIGVATLPFAVTQSLREEAGAGSAARGTVVLNAGIAPGVTNLVAADLLREHPSADEVEIALTFAAGGVNGRAGREFAHRGLAATRRHRTATIPLPEPFGERRCLEFAEGERGWLGAVAADRAVRTYACFSERPIHATLLALNRIGATGAFARVAAVAGPKGPPRRPSSEPIAQWVAVLRGGERLAARTVEAKGDYVSTAAVALALAERLREAGAPGCFDPEELFGLEELAPRLREAGVEVVPRLPSPTLG
jgi:hypothetical protein